jgi:rod shape-determining protein MreD
VTSTPRRGTALSLRREWTRKLLTWSALALLLAVLEESFFARLSGLFSDPDLILILILLVALRGGEQDGAAAGVCAGFLSDAVAGSVLSLSPIFGFFCGYLCGYFGRGFFRSQFANFAVWLGICATAKQILLLLWRLIVIAVGRFPSAVTSSPLREFCLSLLATFLLALPVYGVWRVWNKT